MLFDDNIGFTTYGIPQELFSGLMPDNITITSPKEGFMRGNMYEKEFKPYKNYTYKILKPTNKRNELLMEIMMYDFAVNDLNLSLDLHPDDENLFKAFKKYMALAYEKEMEYIKTYGPLQLDEVSATKYNWLDDPWPWNDTEEAKYV